MGLRIHNDQNRFNDVIKGKIKQNLRQFIKSGQFISKKGNDQIAVPISRVDLPHFRFHDKSQGGLGQGPGQKGDSLSQGDQEGQSEAQKAGSESADHGIDVDVPLSELAKMLGEELELPNIEKSGNNSIRTQTSKYSGIHTSGPNSLRHFRRSYKNALKRQMAQGTYDPTNPCVIPIREDMRYRSFKPTTMPKSNAVIIYMMDVSGSMGDEQKEIVRIESFWIDTWLRSNYDGLECRYIVHDAMAKEVDRHTFFHTRESGGTMISSAYRLCAEIIEADYPSDMWNIYPFHFSDGDNWSVDDTRLCVGLLRKRILPLINQFSYGQVDSPYGSGQFIKDLKDQLKSHEKLALSEIKDKDAIYQSIKDFLARGK